MHQASLRLASLCLHLQRQSRRHCSATAQLVKPTDQSNLPPPTFAQISVQSVESSPTWTLSPADITRLSRQRNIGISAHIDSGKTTLTERVLYYTGRVRDIHEVRGRDGVGAKMDSMELEREKGITIQSAATFCDWNATLPGEEQNREKHKFAVNIIDTPGHVDFTIEVERALRVLDGAVLVLCAVSGVQSQTITVDRQMKRYNVPRLSFINKMDRPGSNPDRIVRQIRDKLRVPCAAVQIPIGVEDEFKGVVDLVSWKAYYNDGPKGEQINETAVPQDLLASAKQKRNELIEALSEVDETLSELYLTDSTISTSDLASAIRRATISSKFSPVFLGSAIKNTAVQPLLDGVCAYLPNPNESVVVAHSTPRDAKTDGEQITLVPAADAPLVALAFKLEESKFGQLTYMRIYQGCLKKGSFVVHARTGKKVKVMRLVRMHSDEMEDCLEVGSGEICAIFGVECKTGDTFTDGSTNLTMTSMFVPDPVISLSIKPKGVETPHFSKALAKFQREDPTFKVHIDHESKETIISGMGELHLEIYVERLKREYNVECITGKPRVAFRETISTLADFSFIHKKQTGGAGQFAKVVGYIEPVEEATALSEEEEAALSVKEKKQRDARGDLEFENRVMSGNIPSGYIPGVEKGFIEACQKGSLTGNQVKGARFVLEDGAFHAVDSSELAFRMAAIGAFREAFKKAQPLILEPIMTVEVVAPVEFQNGVIAGVNSRRGSIVSNEVRQEEFTVIAEVALNDMFGYAGALRGSTQGKGEFSMEYKTHAPVLPGLQKEMENDYRLSLGIKASK